MPEIAGLFLRSLQLLQFPIGDVFRTVWIRPPAITLPELQVAQNCPNSISCSAFSPSDIDTCCVNHPGGHFLLTQFWDTSPSLGKNDTWTIHGLWPDHCTGGFDAFCDKSRSRSAQQITQILSRASREGHEGYGSHPGLIEFMAEHWLSTSSRNSDLWAHEWNKHGTCVSTLEPQCYGSSDAASKTETDDAAVLDYFAHAAYLFTTLDTFSSLAEHGIVPSHSETYELEHLQRAVASTGHGKKVTFKCRNHNEISEVWYHFSVRGSLRDAQYSWSDDPAKVFIPASPDNSVDNCPPRVKYVPKSNGKARPAPTTTRSTAPTTTSAVPTGTAQPGTPFTGKGHLMIKVVDDDSKLNTANSGDDEFTGCLIRKGAWYAARSRSSCATFTAHDDVLAGGDDGTGDSNYHLFTLESRYAPCSFAVAEDDEHFECSQDLGFQSIFSNMNRTADEGNPRVLTLSEKHQSTFYAEEVPNGWRQQRIWRSPGSGHERRVQLEIWWESLAV